jgi:hypothetical protein
LFRVLQYHCICVWTLRLPSRLRFLHSLFHFVAEVEVRASDSQGV